MLAEHWNIDADVVLAIKKHHSHEVLKSGTVSKTVCELVAVHLLVEKAIQDYRKTVSGEWISGGALAMEVLNLSTDETKALCEELQAQFLRPNFF
jgi:HD-like signal output (HDOD) protein